MSEIKLQVEVVGGEVEKQPGEVNHDQLVVLQHVLRLNCHSCVVHTLDQTCRQITSGNKPKAEKDSASLHMVYCERSC